MPTISNTSRGNQSADGITAFFGPDIEVEGTLRFESSVLIEGHFKGRIESPSGQLVIGEKAVVDADIEVGSISIRGKVSGSVTAQQRVQLQGTGSLTGELSTPSLQMDETFTFDGSCKMGSSAKQSNAKVGMDRKPQASAASDKNEKREPVAV